MSLEAARDLSIPDLILVLNEKLNLECSNILKSPLPPAASLASVESKVRAPSSAYLNKRGTSQSALQFKSLETRAREILKLIPTLRNAWNQLRPVNRLPQELLSHIVQFLLLDENTFDAKPVIPLTQVCCYWRESITSTPGNWTLISNNRSELTALSLERAKASRLHVTFYMHPFRTVPRYSSLITPYLRNIDTLRVHDLPGIEELTRTLPKFPQSTPNLRSLTLHCAYTGAEWDPTTDPFGSLAHTINRLSLLNVPLYPSILNLKNLTDLTLRYHSFDLQLDTLLAFLEHNRSLERATLDIRFKEPSLRQSRRHAVVKNRLQYLSIFCNNPMNAQALISNVALRRGAHLDISSFDQNTGLNDILSDVSTSHLSNLSSPTFLEYRSYPRNIQLRGRNGSFSFSCSPSSGIPFVEFPLLSLTDVREFRLEYHTLERHKSSLSPPVFHPPSFPALETLAVECDTDVLYFLSALLPNPLALPSLKTLAFLNCVITEDFMEKLTRFASDRKDTTLARLYHVVIVHEDGRFPSATSIRALGRHVPVVDVRFGTELPKDLT